MTRNDKSEPFPKKARRYVTPPMEQIRACAQHICDQMGYSSIEYITGLSSYIEIVSKIHAKHLNQKGTDEAI